MKCNYCDNEKQLCKAHIIPESFFRFMYPNGKVEGDSLVMVADDKEYVSQRRIGIYDEEILCSECDATIGRNYDEYGKKILLDTEPEVFKKVDSGDVLVFKNIDNHKLKLFILSVLWRCSISKLPELAHIKLPDKFESRLKEMLKKNDAGTINEFSVLFTRFSYENFKLNFSKYFQLPRPKFIIDRLNYIYIYFPNGYKVLVKVDSRNQLNDLLPLSISSHQPIYIVRHEKFEKSSEIKKLIDNAYKIKSRKIGQSGPD